MDDPDRASMVIVAVLLATVLLRLFLVALVVWLLIPRRRTCPPCSEVTVPIREPSFLRYLLLERRWCTGCGWNGVARRGQVPTPEPKTTPTTSVMSLVLLVSVA